MSFLFIFYLHYFDFTSRYTLLISAIIPEKNNTINHCFKFNATVWNISLKNGTYNTKHIKIIETSTAPTNHIFVNNFISNIECLSDLHSKTWIS